MEICQGAFHKYEKANMRLLQVRKYPSVQRGCSYFSLPAQLRAFTLTKGKEGGQDPCSLCWREEPVKEKRILESQPQVRCN